MKTNHLYPIIAGLLLTSSASTFAFPSYDPFADATGAAPGVGSTYTVGQQLGANPTPGIAGQTNAWGDTWSAIGTSAATPTGALGVSVFSGSLVPTYGTFPSGFMTSSGNSVMTTNVIGYSARLNLGKTFTNATGSKQVYASFLIRADNIAALSSSGVGAFNASFNQGSGVSSSLSANFPGELRLIADSTHSTYRVGISKDAPAAGQVAFDSTNRNPGDVVFVIMSYQYVDNTADVASLWINPDPTTFGATTAPAAAQSANYSVNNANDFSINSLQIMSRNTTQPNRMIFDEVRVGSTWAFVTGGPEITSQPTSLTKGAGTTANFSVAARNGSGNALTFQWFKGATQLSDGGNLSGTTSSNLTVSSVTTSDAASYTCVVGNTIGNITSSVGALSITDPSITTQPVTSQSVAPGSTVNMSIVAVGAAPLTYKWRLNNTELTEDGIHIINSGTSTLTVANVQVGDSGTYTCVVTNGVNNTATSANSVLSIANPIVTSQPTAVATNFDSTATFSVTVAGTSPFHYQWQKNGVNLTEGGATGNGGTATGATVDSASTSATLTLTHVAFSDAASYSCVVTNDQGDSLPHSTTSSSAALTVQDPVFTSQPSSQIVNQGQSATFTITAAGTPTIGYQWLKGSTALVNGSGVSVTNGATSASLQLSGVTSANAGNYKCVITGADGKSYTNAAVSLTVITPVTVITGPTNRFLRVGDHTALVVSASGTSPISYQWDRNGVNIGGATSSVLSLSSLQIANSGTYTVTMTNAFSPSPITASAIVDVTSSLRHLAVGNLVVSRLGDGGQTLQVTNGNTIYIDQFETNGNYVSSVMIPDDTSVNAGALIVAGQDANGGAAGLGEAVLTSSPNNTYLSLAGYNVTRPYTNISGATISGDNASVEPRGIGLVNGLGYYQMPLKITASAITGSLRSAYTDDSGTNFWLVGGSLGVRYFNSDSTGSGVSITGGSGNNNRFVDVFGGNMYFDSATNTGGIFKMTGSPTIAAANTQLITYPFQNQVNEFAVSSDGQTIYLTSGAIGDSAGTGVERWDFNGSIWVSNKVFTYSSGLGARGLVVDWTGFSGGGASGTNATLYFTTAETNNNKLVKVVDVVSPTTTLLASAGPSQVFRSVKFAPTASAPSITSDPSATVAASGSTVTITAGVAGSAPLTVTWQKNGTPISNGPTGNGSTYAGCSTTTLTITGAVAADSGSYSIGSVMNDLGSAGPSGNGVLTVLNPGTTTHTNYSDTVVFTATAGTVSGVTYQWKKAGNNLSNGTTTNGSVVIGATSASLTIQNVNYGDGSGDSGTARTYSCTVTATSSGSSAFQTDGLSVSDPYLVSASGNQTVGVGQTAIFTATAAGSPSINYSWKKNQSNIADGPTGTGATYAGATTASLTILNVQPGDQGEYEAKLGGCCG
ncbi:MAG: beta strand repeat-containing protein, partial [Limisphaerales bacterium]